MIDQESLTIAKNLIQRSQKVLLVPSSPIDGDCLGSALSLFLVLQKLGKQATVVASETIPDTYGFLPQISAIASEFSPSRQTIVTIDCRDSRVKNIEHSIEAGKVNIVITPESGELSPEKFSINYGSPAYDLIITVDGGDTGQFGWVYENNTELFQRIPVLNIDHHISNTHFGKINLVDIMSASTTVIIMSLIETIGERLIDEDIATLLLAGLITDTGSFQNPNTNPDAFAHAAKLIELGARQQEIIQHVYKTKELSTLKLWGRVLSKIQHDEANRLVWSTISEQDLKDTGSTADKSEGIIDELMGNAPGAEVVLLLKDREPNVVSGSIRTLTPLLSAAELAALFGGGGHKQAAGFRMEGVSLEDAEKKVIEAIKNEQKKRLQKNAGDNGNGNNGHGKGSVDESPADTPHTESPRPFEVPPPSFTRPV